MTSENCRVGLISDTHGSLPSEVFTLFDGVAHIVHAGDVGPGSILADLESIASVTAVWGNTDGFELRSRVPEIGKTEVCSHGVLVVHGHQVGSPTPLLLAQAYPQGEIVVYGHTHRPNLERVGSRIFVNPGSAGAPRFGLAPSIAILTLSPGEAQVRFLNL